MQLSTVHNHTYDNNGNRLTITAGAGTPEENEYDDLFVLLKNADGATYTYGPDDLRWAEPSPPSPHPKSPNGSNLPLSFFIKNRSFRVSEGAVF